ncbi:MAG: N-acetyl-gamma-glutamyl-phosphate reductase, partial [Anaerolineales bacterium]|nr:N-acetyl-gamma-glutamyl-phosphate reductase [Anaerolineales bacterium]
MLTAAIIGASGYTGFELAQILADHPQVKLGLATSESFAGQQLSDVYPQAPNITLVSADDADFSQIDVVFLCLPHAAAAPTAARALAAGARVIDLSADFRIKDPEVYSKWYGIEHPHPELIKEAVYGLTEFYRQPLRETDLVATPGCYPTSVLLGLQPLLNEGLFNSTIIADSKSGVSGAGRKPTMTTHFVEAADN